MSRQPGDAAAELKNRDHRDCLQEKRHSEVNTNTDLVDKKAGKDPRRRIAESKGAYGAGSRHSRQTRIPSKTGKVTDDHQARKGTAEVGQIQQPELGITFAFLMRPVTDHLGSPRTRGRRRRIPACGLPSCRGDLQHQDRLQPP